MAMPSDDTFKLLDYLYQVAPARKTKTEISKEAFGSSNHLLLEDVMNRLLDKGYVYQWKYYTEDNAPFRNEEEYGITVKGIVSHDEQNPDDKKWFQSEVAERQSQRPPDIVNQPVQPDIDTGSERNFSFRRAVPVIILIAFAIALIWFITHLRK
jgi:hypothetical protein